jgi:N-acetylglucosaminyldiphosphoundecaprenol N-acetyl-beta-D-mannosaminyltransferase
MVLAESELETLSVMGLPVHYTSDYVGWLRRRIEQRQGTHVITLNAEMCMQAQQDEQLRRFIKSADLVAPDGSGIELYFRLMGDNAAGKDAARLQRYPGIELAADVLQRLGPSSTVAFYGGKPEVVEAAARYWRGRSPQLNLTLVQHGYAQGADLDAFIDRLAQVQPDLIFVGLGVPRQEFWIAAHRHLCPRAVWIGVGGSYDIWSGLKDRAPKWMRRVHLEWLYRLYQEPWRWRRMLALPQFVWASFWYRRRQE